MNKYIETWSDSYSAAQAEWIISQYKGSNINKSDILDLLNAPILSKSLLDMYNVSSNDVMFSFDYNTIVNAFALDLKTIVEGYAQRLDDIKKHENINNETFIAELNGILDELEQKVEMLESSAGFDGSNYTISNNFDNISARASNSEVLAKSLYLDHRNNNKSLLGAECTIDTSRKVLTLPYKNRYLHSADAVFDAIEPKPDIGTNSYQLGKYNVKEFIYSYENLDHATIAIDINLNQSAFISAIRIDTIGGNKVVIENVKATILEDGNEVEQDVTFDIKQHNVTGEIFISFDRIKASFLKFRVKCYNPIKTEIGSSVGYMYKFGIGDIELLHDTYYLDGYFISQPIEVNNVSSISLDVLGESFGAYGSIEYLIYKYDFNIVNNEFIGRFVYPIIPIGQEKINNERLLFTEKDTQLYNTIGYLRFFGHCGISISDISIYQNSSALVTLDIYNVVKNIDEEGQTKISFSSVIPGAIYTVDYIPAHKVKADGLVKIDDIASYRNDNNIIFKQYDYGVKSIIYLGIVMRTSDQHFTPTLSRYNLKVSSYDK